MNYCPKANRCSKSAECGRSPLSPYYACFEAAEVERQRKANSESNIRSKRKRRQSQNDIRRS